MVLWFKKKKIGWFLRLILRRCMTRSARINWIVSWVLSVLMKVGGHGFVVYSKILDHRCFWMVILLKQGFWKKERRIERLPHTSLLLSPKQNWFYDHHKISILISLLLPQGILFIFNKEWSSKVWKIWTHGGIHTSQRSTDGYQSLIAIKTNVIVWKWSLCREGFTKCLFEPKCNASFLLNGLGPWHTSLFSL